MNKLPKVIPTNSNPTDSFPKQCIQVVIYFAFILSIFARFNTNQRTELWSQPGPNGSISL